MSNFQHSPNSNGKFEFELDKSIGKSTENKDRISHRFAKNRIEKFISEFGITDEPVVIESDIPTFVKLLGDILMSYEITFEDFKSNHIS